MRQNCFKECEGVDLFTKVKDCSELPATDEEEEKVYY